MKIEIALPQRFSQSGKSLLRLIQNNDMPVLDLLVRESIQNSLDAWDKKADNVLVEFNSGQFYSNKLADELDGITGALNKRYGNNLCNYISVSDSNTCGLTGDINDPNGEDGNLQKLIYQICRAQEGEGAGGSWGIGKTVYFRVGIGLVIYYSRISLGNGKYQSRMAASLVEDESKVDAMIPTYKGNKKRGVAWWGQLIDENLTIATTNEVEIQRMLSIFGLKAYAGEKVGTTIIIPYTNNSDLLQHNVMEYNDALNHKLVLPWTKSIDAYLKMATQRWYAPRLNNKYYYKNKNTAYLKVKVNGNQLGSMLPEDDDCEPIFQLIKSLYNRAAFGNQEYGDLLSKEIYNLEPINVRGVLEKETAGQIAFVQVDKKVLHMIPPYNKYNPAIYLNEELISPEQNRPIICYVRKPGMIVSYEMVGEWTDGIPTTDKEHFIVGIFVLNSENELKKDISDITLEEYVRQSELADHTSWTDITIKNKNPRIVGRIKKNVSSKIGKVFKDAISEKDSNVNTGYSKFFGDILLPPENFGKKPRIPGKPGTKDPTQVVQHKDVTLKIGAKGIQYKQGELHMTFDISTKRPVNYLEIDSLIVASDAGGAYSADEWIQLLQVGKNDFILPFELNGASFSMSKWKNEKVVSAFAHLKDGCESVSFKDLNCTYKYAKNGARCGVIVKADKEYNFAFKCTFKLKINKLEFKSQLGVSTKRGES